jgi:hypothetical protein
MMYALKRLLTQDEIDMVFVELKRLFIFQDRIFDEEKQATWLHLLRAEWDYPFKAIISGIRSLHRVELKSIKPVVVENAIRNFSRREYTGPECPHCGREGRVSMQDPKTRFIYSLACTCALGGILAAAQNLNQWGGLPEQTVNGRTLQRL